ncbi:MAG: hypothetical protein ACE5FI_13860 [Anaerolineales bacterium]
MGDRATQVERLRRVIERRRVAEMKALRRASPGRSQRSLFRDLSQLDYLSSYTHAGRYYTLASIPEFDEYGLWFYKAVGFSRMGTLKKAVAELVDTSAAGYLHRELEHRVRIRVHNTLLDLVRAKQLGRASLGPRKTLYVSADANRAAAQRDRRRAEQVKPLAAPIAAPVIATETEIAILIEAIHSADKLASADVLADRLGARGIVVTADQIEQVLSHYGIDAEKKTPASRSRRSRR